MRGLFQIGAYILGAGALASLLATPYFRPERPWPAWVAGLVILVAAIAVLTFPHKPSREALLEEYDTLKNRQQTERAIAEDRNRVYDSQSRRKAELAAEEIETKLRYMRRTGRLPD